MFANKEKKHSYKIPLQEIQFICEQDGLPEQELKAQLSEIFAHDKSIQNAYLVRTSYKCSDEYLVALCLSISSGRELPRVRKITKTFSHIFNQSQHLEVIFLDSALESQVSKVCTPFYVKKSKKGKPDFYLASSEWKPLYEPRKCWIKSRYKYYGQDDLCLVQIEPPVLYNDGIYGTVELNEVLLASRHEGYTVTQIREWPLSVYLLKLKKPAIDPKVNELTEKDIEKVAWAELYPSLSVAQKAMHNYKYE